MSLLVLLVAFGASPVGEIDTGVPSHAGDFVEAALRGDGTLVVVNRSPYALGPTVVHQGESLTTLPGLERGAIGELPSAADVTRVETSTVGESLEWHPAPAPTPVLPAAFGYSEALLEAFARLDGPGSAEEQGLRGRQILRVANEAVRAGSLRDPQILAAVGHAWEQALAAASWRHAPETEPSALEARWKTSEVFQQPCRSVWRVVQQPDESKKGPSFSGPSECIALTRFPDSRRSAVQEAELGAILGPYAHSEGELFLKMGPRQDRVPLEEARQILRSRAAQRAQSAHTRQVRAGLVFYPVSVWTNVVARTERFHVDLAEAEAGALLFTLSERRDICAGVRSCPALVRVAAAKILIAREALVHLQNATWRDANAASTMMAQAMVLKEARRHEVERLALTEDALMAWIAASTRPEAIAFSVSTVDGWQKRWALLDGSGAVVLALAKMKPGETRSIDWYGPRQIRMESRVPVAPDAALRQRAEEALRAQALRAYLETINQRPQAD